ncbi:MAG: hypothetical protein K2X27_15685 [Candidatus Obscuribacterales bacterium]|nr:hypothetical protein [Candidatus Obscuribacterales bacterium]
MLHYSKFVNTKAYQKANSSSNKSHFPALPKSESPVKLRRMSELQMELGPQECSEAPATAEAEKIKESPKMHASVNLQEMQRMEELNKKDSDWLSFFLGQTTAQNDSGPEPDASCVVSYAEGDFYFNQAPITTPPPHAEFTEAEPSPPESEYFENIQEKPNPFPEALPSSDFWQLSNESLKAGVLDTFEIKQAEQKADCLEKIFEELISEDKVFKLNCL